MASNSYRGGHWGGGHRRGRGHHGGNWGHGDDRKEERGSRGWDREERGGRWERGGARGSWRQEGRGGRRDYRNKRGRGGGGRYFDPLEDSAYDQDEAQASGWGSQERRGGRGRKCWGPPAGLSGRDIGMWYAARGKKKAMEMELQSRTFIKIDENKERHLQELLSTIRGNEQVAPQNRKYSLDDEEPEKTEEKTIPEDWFDEPEQSQNAQTIARGSNKIETKESPKSTAPSTSDFEFAEPQQNLAPVKTECAEDEESDEDFEVTNAELVASCEDAERRWKEEMEYDTEGEDESRDMEEFLDYEENNEFIMEFLNHNEENRRNSQKNKVPLPRVSLERIPVLDAKLKEELEEKFQKESFKRMLEFRKKLPSYKMRTEILKVISENQVVVVSGETGCGKTTQISQFILDDFIMKEKGSCCRIVSTQPRRISAISVAERVAQERGESCGTGSVGYQIRLESKMPREVGSILYCTTGILLKSLISDPALCRTSHVILDEIHEQDLHSDFLMIILKDLLEQRKDLKVVLMSATINSHKFSRYFNNCPMVKIPDRTFPVKEFLLEDVLELTNYFPEQVRRQKIIRGRKGREYFQERMDFEGWVERLPAQKFSQETKEALKTFNYDDIDLDLIVAVVRHIMLNKPDGAILVFLPGWDQISKLHSLLSKQTMFSPGNCRIIPLHSLMPTVNQREVFQRPPPGVRKIVIATNIAETSITIDDVVYVIDCGKIKQKNFDQENKLATLKVEPVSRANAQQRRGRAGRVQPGECYHLYTGWHERQLAPDQLPEILRTTLEELCLQIKMLKLGMIIPFISKAMQPPSLEALQFSIQTLRDLCALDEKEDLTPLGYHLAKMPVDPRAGKMLLMGALFCCLDPILTIAASLSFKDAFIIPLGKEKLADQVRMKLAGDTRSDHIMLAKAFQGWERAKIRGTAKNYCWENFLSPFTLKLLSDMRRQFTELLFSMKFLSSKDPHNREANLNSENLKLVRAIICAGLYPNVCKMKPKRPHSKRPAILSSNAHRRIQFHPKSVNAAPLLEFDQHWFVYHLLMKANAVFVYDSTMIPPYPLLFFGGVIDIRKDHGQDCIVVDDWIVFKSSKRIAHLVRELRIELDRLLEHKITHPGATNWNPREKEGALMNAITDLITTEEHSNRKTFNK